MRGWRASRPSVPLRNALVNVSSTNRSSLSACWRCVYHQSRRKRYRSASANVLLVNQQLVHQWEEEEGTSREEGQHSPDQAHPPPSAYLSFAQPSPSVLSRWVISCCSIQWLQAIVQGQWRWQHVLTSLSRLARFFCPNPRPRRSQRFQLEPWPCFRLKKLISP